MQQTNVPSLKIIDKTITDGEERYLVHFLGQHRLNARWVEKAALIEQNQSARPIIQHYDKQLEIRCRQLKSTEANARRQKSRENRSSSGQSSSSKRKVRRGRPRLRHQQQIFEKAKADLTAAQTKKIIPADEFVLHIRTPMKLECNWVFGDKLTKVIQKQAGQQLYKVMWENGSTTVVKEKDIIARDPRKFCEFWEKKLGLRRSAKSSQKE